MNIVIIYYYIMSGIVVYIFIIIVITKIIITVVIIIIIIITVDPYIRSSGRSGLGCTIVLSIYSIRCVCIDIPDGR